ncbi:MAG: hypothetical protein KGS72_05720 [Cyanobacteria bacterium REEB67]|nr:hypothetical protein [Cyanobacteria bacterium REEB67]
MIGICFRSQLGRIVLSLCLSLVFFNEPGPSYALSLNDVLSASEAINIKISLGDYAEAESDTLAALTRCEHNLHDAPTSLLDKKRQANLLNRLGYIQRLKARYQDAESTIQKALDCCDAYLAESPNDTFFLWQKSRCIANLGNFYVNLSQKSKANDCFLEELALVDRALKASPDDSDLKFSRGMALMDCALDKKLLSDTPGAWADYAMALSEFKGLKEQLLPSGNVPFQQAYTYYKLALADWEMGKTKSAQNDTAKALQLARRAIAAEPKQLEGRQISLRLETLLISDKLSQNKTKAAARLLKTAQSECKQLLALAPHNPDSLRDKVDLLGEARKFSQRDGDDQLALSYCEQQAKILETLLSESPDDLTTISRQSSVYASMAKLQAKLSGQAAASASYQKALSSIEHQQKIAGLDWPPYARRGMVLGDLAHLQSVNPAGMLNPDMVIKTFNESIIAYDQAIRIAPNEQLIYVSKVLTLIDLARYEYKNLHYSEAKKAVEDCLKCIHQVNSTKNAFNGKLENIRISAEKIAESLKGK